MLKILFLVMVIKVMRVNFFCLMKHIKFKFKLKHLVICIRTKPLLNLLGCVLLTVQYILNMKVKITKDKIINFTVAYWLGFLVSKVGEI